ncbi:MAG TPA: hypothetical protein VMM77_00795 [Gemmatimonadaceae bacterium]|nr:hypothetical protein [Gemmatimonadaceae bacterium]
MPRCHMQEHPEFDPLFLVREPRSRWERSGLTPVQERWFNIVALTLLVLFTSGWGYSISVSEAGSGIAPASFTPLSSRIIAPPLAPNAPPVAAFLIDGLLEELAKEIKPLRGASGELNVVLQQPGDELALPALSDTVPEGTELSLRPAEGTGSADDVAFPAPGPSAPGIWNLVLQLRDAVRTVSDLNVITLVPLSERKGGRIGQYVVGSWPTERGPARPNYEVPRGLIQVTPENRHLQVSEHLQLGDFLTKGQANVWPKYVALSPRLLDKLELTFQELERSGHRVDRVFVVSGFRTPIYNETGGNTGGRGKLSRHMYGDAADVAIDNDGDGRMDDLNGDGRVTVADARIIAEAAQRVELRHPELVGGIGVYPPTAAHSGFVHIDTRGYRSRWGAW